MRSETIGAAAYSVASLVLLAGCRDPTQITVEITTDVPCDQTKRTAITVASLEAFERGKASAVTTTTSCHDGRVGSLVVIPSGDRSADLSIRVVTGVDQDVDTCSATTSYAGCIVARRHLHFVEHSSLSLPVVMRRSCLDLPCDERQTCVQGHCVGSTIVDPKNCIGSGCDEGTLTGDGDAGPLDSSFDSSFDSKVDVLADTGVDSSLDVVDADGAVVDPFGDRRGLLSGAPWPMVNGSPTLWNLSSMTFPKTKALRWTAPATTSTIANLVGPDGLSYYGDFSGYYAIDEATHLQKWAFGGSGYGDPALGSDGVLYGASTGLLFALDRLTGAKNWELPVDAVGDITLGPGPIAYIGGLGGIAAVDVVAKKQLWSVPLAEPFEPPSLGSAGKLYIASGIGDVREFDMKTGTAGWTFHAADGVSSPVIYGNDGAVYFATANPTGLVYAVEVATGLERWKTTIDGGVYYALARGADGTLYVGSSAGTLYAIETSKGGILWSTPHPSITYRHLLVDRTNVLVAVTTLTVEAMDATKKGASVWSYMPSVKPVTVAPGGDGLLYVLTDSSLDALGP